MTTMTQLHTSTIHLRLTQPHPVQTTVLHSAAAADASATCSRVADTRPARRQLHLDIAAQPADSRHEQPPGPALSTTSTRHRRRSTDSRKLMGCMSGQRSPTSPAYCLTFPVDSRPPIAGARCATGQSTSSGGRRSSKNPPLSVFSYPSTSGESTDDCSLPKTCSVDSGVDITSSSGGSSEKEEERRRPSIGSCSSSGTTAALASTSKRGRSVKSLKHSLVFGSSDHLESLGRTKDAMTSSSPPAFGCSPKPDRKQTQSPALWRSISSSSLVRSLSRRRAASKSRSGGESDGSRSKLSSVDTDSDCENKTVERSSRRRRRIDVAESRQTFQFPSTSSSVTDDSRRQSDTGLDCSSSTSAVAASKHSRRRSGGGFFSRSFRRARSTPAEEFVAMSTSPSNEPEMTPPPSYGSLSRLRSSRRRAAAVAAAADNTLTSSSRAASLSSLRSGGGRAGLDSPRSTGRQQQQQFIDDTAYLVNTLSLDQFVSGKLISGLAMTDKNELVIVDFRSAYIVDAISGRLIRVVGGKGSGRLVEPIGVAAGPEGRLAFSDHADQTVKIYSSRGQVVRTVSGLGLTNVGGVGVCRQSADVFVAGTGSRQVVVARCAAVGAGRTDSRTTHSGVQLRDGPLPVSFQHPYSVAVSPINGDVIVGDDYAQTVTSLSRDGRTISWCWSPRNETDRRPFFPSSICVDPTSGHVFVADLYNTKVYMLDGATGTSCVAENQPVLCRGGPDGLRGGPSALCVDAKCRLYVADEDKTIHVFDYSNVAAAAAACSGQTQQPLQSIEQQFNYSTVDAGNY